MPAQNKPLTEYGDSQSVHHMDKVREEAPELIDEPPRLVVASGPGNLSVIKWTSGDAPIPQMCAGSWNHKGKAQEAINGAVVILKAEGDAVKMAEIEAERVRIADEEAIQAAKEIAEEQERIQAEADKDIEEMEARADAEAAASKPKPQAKKKTTTTK